MDIKNHIKAIKREYPSQIPIAASILPSAWMKHRQALEEIVRTHPLVFGEQTGQRDYDEVYSRTYAAGQHIDVWGCIWSNLKTGMESIVTGHPVPTREAVHLLEIPAQDDNMPHGFMYLRLGDLRGFDQIMLDFAEEPPELQILLDKVLAYNLRQAGRRLKTLEKPGQIVYFGDDLGMQTNLPISPKKWRRYLKPCYCQIFAPFKQAGHYVYMHSDGHILDIIPDLVECGVDVLNPQVGANGLQNLAKAGKGKVCIDLDLDRQKFPFWNPNDIDRHIKEAVEILGSPEGGLWLRAEIGDDIPLENVEAICVALEKYSTYYST